MHFGIDFGGQHNGTTAICYDAGGRLHVIQCSGTQRADDFILDAVRERTPGMVFIDAPLSLPRDLTGPEGDEVMYRAADRETNAMSPMFLGALTARAIRLSRQLRNSGVSCVETYPKAALQLHFSEAPAARASYGQLERWIARLESALPLRWTEPPANRHQFDAVVCWWSGERYLRSVHTTYGEESEGLIIV